MKKTFVKDSQLDLINGGYLVTGKEEKPVYNEEFYLAQMNAEWLITFADKAKGKDFIGKPADSLEEVKAEVLKHLAKSDTEYVKAPKEVKLEITKKLEEEALAFIGYGEEVSKTDKINKFLQKFNIIQEFEDFGLYFDEGICKLNRIYTVKDIVAAVTSVIDVLEEE